MQDWCAASWLWGFVVSMCPPPPISHFSVCVGGQRCSQSNAFYFFHYFLYRTKVKPWPLCRCYMRLGMYAHTHTQKHSHLMSHKDHGLSETWQHAPHFQFTRKEELNRNHVSKQGLPSLYWSWKTCSSISFNDQNIVNEWYSMKCFSEQELNIYIARGKITQYKIEVFSPNSERFFSTNISADARNYSVPFCDSCEVKVWSCNSKGLSPPASVPIRHKEG